MSFVTYRAIFSKPEIWELCIVFLQEHNVHVNIWNNSMRLRESYDPQCKIQFMDPILTASNSILDVLKSR
jgi:hypothetical protein